MTAHDEIFVVEFPPAPEWHADALCRQIGGDEWFPNKGESAREAKKICASCPVTSECLQYALDHDERFGIWGGLTERDRRNLKRTTQ